ncbi:MAG TPA: type VI secretion system contractile sheath large subunit, partial [Alphaproteobacteria bacterium]|nr:type VI secretion system contractile sheath large subunit [Alphaproteobacteria bacterium]
MAESIQHKLSRVRPPRVQITYDVEIGDAIEMKELPFVMGVLADLSGMAVEALPKLKDRKFTQIDRDNFTQIMEAIAPRLALAVPNLLGGDAEKLSCELFFKAVDDFGPVEVLSQIPALKALYDSRSKLKDLQAKLDGNDALDGMLLKLGNDKDYQSKLKAEVEGFSLEGDHPLVTELFEQGKMARAASQQAFSFELIKEYLSQVEQFAADGLKDVEAFTSGRIGELDEIVTKQLNLIMHHEAFQALEGSWRGLFYFVMNTETSTRLKIRLLNVTKKELLNDLEKAVEFDQSQLFKKIYEEEYGTFGGHPYSCLLGDFYFTRHPQDFALLEKLAQVAAAAHAPFIAAAHPNLFDLDKFEDLGTPRDLSKIFESLELTKWSSFRKSEDSRYVSLVLPRVLIRLPYGSNTVPVEGINFEEEVAGADTSRFCWTNAAYALGQRITNAFALYSWTSAIRGVEGGGLVEGLPAFTYTSQEGDVALKCPTETIITDRREKELSDLGFISLCHCKGTDFAAFFGGQTTQKA